MYHVCILFELDVLLIFLFFQNLQVDPGLQLVDGIWLQAVSIESDKERISYGSLREDEVAALKSLSAVELDDQLLRETVISHFMIKFAKLSEVIFLFSNIISKEMLLVQLANCWLHEMFNKVTEIAIPTSGPP